MQLRVHKRGAFYHIPKDLAKLPSNSDIEKNDSDLFFLSKRIECLIKGENAKGQQQH